MDTKPSKKTSLEVLAGALVTVLVWVAAENGLNIPEYIGAAVVTLIVGAFAYFVPAKSGKYVEPDATPVGNNYEPRH
ncbi:holin [Brevibacterium phage 4C]|uniref:Holin n=31 Tax=Agmunavirus AGM1 TaxID=2843882 RepID=A0A7D0GK68_9CAUD|nr:holin [Brevibacterium phage AGM1]QDH85669.1 holin [Brevibacterium phage AGM2]QDH85722.1 holin [Brevibacterium phage AGM3]QDH85775.1 holin [Brevibacterium phage AGM4]QDH85828.1 holin [Brevibacterium phage AGM5]QDH85881.1 holin [Brevibacterium phage AGM6]QDH85934.1 holin [Brevibacterium phage AGM7]QDH85987.1 holin [Brevibacterium phage AGM8]QDH86040.1 holin [Brevibacterium phage AGM9]QDH86093.1 holin [Brevibacterium phage AGM10]QDH86146.1 holin [Brevibacterium phage AGM11]QDH86199.1 hol